MKRGINIYLFVSIICLLVWTSLTIASVSEQAKLVASDGASMDRFGCSVSISGDYAIIGAYSDKNGEAQVGSAYIFKRNGETWSEQVKLAASDINDGDGFGGSVSISGDYAIVGAVGDDDKGIDSGSAYIFKRNGKKWSEQAKLIASDGAANDCFGDVVSISGDYAIIGAYGDDDKGTFTGAAYIFKRKGKTWHEQAKLVPSDGEENDYFGRSVSISGGYAIVGSYLDDDNGNASGSAYVFKRQPKSWFKPEAWSEHTKLLASDGVSPHYFGCSVSIDGDYIIGGAYYDADNGKYAGAAYIFKRDGESWSEQAKLLASDGATEDYFGRSVSISGDYAIVGAFGDDDKKSYSGSAYIFKRNGMNWKEQAKLVASDGRREDFFGEKVSISGDCAIVGAFGNDARGENSGSAYIFKCDVTGGKQDKTKGGKS